MQIFALIYVGKITGRAVIVKKFNNSLVVHSTEKNLYIKVVECQENYITKLFWNIRGDG